MFSVAQATAKAYSLIGSTHDPDGSSWSNECCHSVGICYGFAHSGYPRAIDHWNGIPDKYKHTGLPPTGACCFYAGGSGSAGHETFSFGDSTCLSSDILKDGRLDHVQISLPVTKWGLTYLGWTDPYFSGNVIVLGADVAMTQADANLFWSTPILRRDVNGVVYSRTALQELADCLTIGLELRKLEPIIAAMATKVPGGLTDADKDDIAKRVLDGLFNRLSS